MATVAQIIKKLQRRDPDSHVAVSIWGPGDIDDDSLTDEQKNEIIDEFHNDQSAEDGLNNATLEAVCSFYRHK